MRQHSTVPLLAVILAAVLSGGKSFSQSLASHAICLPDTGMRLLLPLPLLPLTAAFISSTPSHHPLLSPGILTSYFSPSLLTYHSLTCFSSFHTYSPNIQYILQCILPQTCSHTNLFSTPFFPPIFCTALSYCYVSFSTHGAELEVEGMHHLWLCPLSSRRIYRRVWQSPVSMVIPSRNP